MTKYLRNAGKHWTVAELTLLKQLAQQNTPTRVIGLKIGRSADAIQAKASEIDLSLKPVNQSPYNRKK